MKKRFHCGACGRKFRAKAEKQPYTKNGIRAACPEGHPVDESDIIPGRIAWCAKLPFKAVAGASMYPLFLAMQTVRRMCLGIKGAAFWVNEFANPWAKRDRAKAVTHEQLDHGLNSMAEFVRMVKNEMREEIEGVRASVSLPEKGCHEPPERKPYVRMSLVGKSYQLAGCYPNRDGPPGSGEIHLEHQGHKIPLVKSSERHGPWYDEMEIEGDERETQMFLTMRGRDGSPKTRAKANFEGDYTIIPEGRIAIIEEVRIEHALPNAEDWAYEIHVQGSIVLRGNVAEAAKYGQKCNIVVPGGRSLDVRLNGSPWGER